MIVLSHSQGLKVSSCVRNELIRKCTAQVNWSSLPLRKGTRFLNKKVVDLLEQLLEMAYFEL